MVKGYSSNVFPDKFAKLPLFTSVPFNNNCHLKLLSFKFESMVMLVKLTCKANLWPVKFSFTVTVNTLFEAFSDTSDARIGVAIVVFIFCPWAYTTDTVSLVFTLNFVSSCEDAT